VIIRDGTSDLVDPVAAMAARLSAPVGMVGSTEASLSAAAKALEGRHKGLSIRLKVAPRMGFDPAGDESAELIESIRRSGVRICFVALGAPKQEIFAAKAMKALPHVGFLSVGAGLDFVSGEQKRAPEFVRALAAEWMWRLMMDPRRLAKRYASCAAILPGLAVGAVKSRRTQRSIVT
jgi:N-acetylglucosaminyldiphosphoundecaprenol N-acetyl-beta-D-mannosaminyltransferase